LLTAQTTDSTRPVTRDVATVVRSAPSADVKSSSTPLLKIAGAIGVAVVLAIGSWYVVNVMSGTVPPARDVAATSRNETNAAPGASVSDGSDRAQSGSPVAKPVETKASESKSSASTTDADAGSSQAVAAETTDPEDLILRDFDVPADVHNFRRSHIAGTLLAYIENKKHFDECQQSGCADLARLMQNVLGNQQADWKDPAGCQDAACSFTGTVTVTNPRRLDRADCPYLIDLTEVLRHDGIEHKQMRTYCTRNGWERTVEHAGPVT
jgi:hypothetical protein